MGAAQQGGIINRHCRRTTVPNGIPGHVMATLLHDSDHLGLLLFAKASRCCQDRVEQVIPDVLPVAAHGGCCLVWVLVLDSEWQVTFEVMDGWGQGLA